MKDTEIIIIGAGAAGLMAARILSQNGKKVLILEARERTGGRIHSFEKKDLGYTAEGGAEFIHGDLPFTKNLAKEAGLTLLPSEGEFWNSRKGNLTQNHEFIPDWNSLMKKLLELKEDMTVAEFMKKYFPAENNKEMNDSIKGFVEGYDAADPNRASILALRDEWMSENEAEQFRIKEGYSALIKFLEGKSIELGSSILFNSEVTSVYMNEDLRKISVKCKDGNRYETSKVILTASLPILEKINFTPAIPEKLNAASQIGYGKVVKFLFRFKDRWWIKIYKDMNKAGFIFSNEEVPTWWTQYPETNPVLTGWLAGPKAEKYIKTSTEELRNIGLISLAGIFKIEKKQLEKDLIYSKIINWGNDPYALGAYAYATPETIKAREVMLQNVNHMLYFSGEALYQGKEMGTVEAALASGARTAEEILEIQ